jgi:hypothetical protein
MMAMVVNDGVVYRPHVVKEIRDGETGALIQSSRPEYSPIPPLAHRPLRRSGKIYGASSPTAPPASGIDQGRARGG